MRKQILGERAVSKSPSAEGLFILGSSAGGSVPEKSLSAYAVCVFPLSLNAECYVRRILVAEPG